MQITNEFYFDIDYEEYDRNIRKIKCYFPKYYSILDVRYIKQDGVLPICFLLLYDEDDSDLELVEYNICQIGHKIKDKVEFVRKLSNNNADYFVFEKLKVIPISRKVEMKLC